MTARTAARSWFRRLRAWWVASHSRCAEPARSPVGGRVAKTSDNGTPS